jgi:mono/diheme cytochrome c family protein
MKRVLSSLLVLVVSFSLSLTAVSCTKKDEKETKDEVAEVIDGAMEKAQEVKEHAAEKVAQMQEHAGEVVENTKEQVAQIADEMKEKAGEVAEQVGEKTGEVVEGAKNMAEDAANKAEEVKEEAKEIVVAEAPTTKGDPTKGKEKFELICASCHGPGGKGDGPAAAALDPKPRDLSDPAYVSTLTDEHIFKTVKEGGASVGKSPLMPAWGGTLTDDDIWNVIAYVRQDICKCQYKEK